MLSVQQLQPEGNRSDLWCRLQHRQPEPKASENENGIESKSENAVKTQIWIAISVYILVAIIKKRLKVEPGLYTILQIFIQNDINHCSYIHSALHESHYLLVFTINNKKGNVQIITALCIA
jgi:hypothetical protein